MLAATIPCVAARKICWALSDEYHAPFVVGGHVRIYTEDGLRRKMRAAGLEAGPSHHAHACTRPTGGSSARSGRRTTTTPGEAYLRLLTWDITKQPLVLQVAEAPAALMGRASSCTPASR